MPEPLRVLLLEDRADDAELLVLELRRAGYEPHWVRVDTIPDYLAQLDQAPEVILADYQLPQFDALLALHLLQVRELDIPFLIVTGSISEEVAVECMKQGAADYLLKDRLARLGQAVALSREKKRLRDAQRSTEAALRDSELRFRQLVESVRDYAIFMLDRGGRIVTWNTGAQRILGYWADEVVGQHYSRFTPEDERHGLQAELDRAVQLGGLQRQCCCVRRDGSRFQAHVVLTPLHDA
ncbi:MAG: PAS domain S-box protein, partial [Gemmataceae bacterium]